MTKIKLEINLQNTTKSSLTAFRTSQENKKKKKKWFQEINLLKSTHEQSKSLKQSPYN